MILRIRSFYKLRLYTREKFIYIYFNNAFDLIYFNKIISIFEKGLKPIQFLNIPNVVISVSLM